MSRSSDHAAHPAHDDHHRHHGHHEGELEDHDLGLSHDLPRIAERQGLLGRRRLLAAFGGLGASAALVACGTDSSSTTTIETGALVNEDGTPFQPVPTMEQQLAAKQQEIDEAKHQADLAQSQAKMADSDAKRAQAEA
ncbi:MAG: hypothetical protein ACPF9W_06035, partial [Nocardioides sp.]